MSSPKEKFQANPTMTSINEPSSISRYFTHHWAITVPSCPNLRIRRATPEYFPACLSLATNPSNNEYQDSRDKVWDEAAISEWRARAQTRYEYLNVHHNGMFQVVELDGQIVGYGDIYGTQPGKASVGIVLDESARGKGVGRKAVQVFVQLGWELGVETIVSGTMKVNEPMRRLMRGLGVEEREEVTEIPGRGVVSECDYTVVREEWEWLEMKVEFGERLGA